MADYEFVLPRVACGAGITAADLPQLEAAGITHVADSTTHDDSVFATPALGFAVIFGNQNDDGNQAEAQAYYQRLAPWFMAAWWGTPQARFLFHCDAGVNRGPSSCYLALRLLGLRPDQAAAAIHAARPQASDPPLYAPAADTAVASLVAV